MGEQEIGNDKQTERVQLMARNMLNVLMILFLIVDGLLLFVAEGGSTVWGGGGGGTSVSRPAFWNGPNGVWTIVLIALGVGALVLLLRPRRPGPQARGPALQVSQLQGRRQPPTSTPGPKEYKTGIIVVPMLTSEKDIHWQVATWGSNHPMDASLAVATCDQLGKVAVRLYETSGSGKLIWSGEVGALATSELPGVPFDTPAFTRQVERPVLALVGQVFG
jgi:hypothetical protein